MDNQELLAFNIISNSGEASSHFYNAIKFAGEGKFEEAEEMLKSANKLIVETHKFQTQLLTEEARGEKKSPSILMVHAQDHLMNAMQLKELAKVIMGLYERVSELEQR